MSDRLCHKSFNIKNSMYKSENYPPTTGISYASWMGEPVLEMNRQKDIVAIKKMWYSDLNIDEPFFLRDPLFHPEIAVMPRL